MADVSGTDDAMLDYREAEESDLDTLVSLLADDALGADREDSTRPLNPRYHAALQAIRQDNNNELIVVESDGELVGMLQLTFIPSLSRLGSWRCQIEGVRISAPFRGRGCGTAVFRWAIARARSRDCQLVQLTSDKQRPDAIRFYESLGFKSTHEGLKLGL